jgi:hypothetical protein
VLACGCGRGGFDTVADARSDGFISPIDGSYTRTLFYGPSLASSNVSFDNLFASRGTLVKYDSQWNGDVVTFWTNALAWLTHAI